MVILGLDLGTKTGWAMNHKKLGLISGVWNFSSKKFDGAGMRFMRFRGMLEETIADNNVEAVFYEAVRRHIGTDAAHIYGGFMATLQALCEEMRIPYAGIPVGKIKKHACGKGNGSKEMMVSAAMAKWPHIKIIDDNHADALWVRQCGEDGLHA